MCSTIGSPLEEQIGRLRAQCERQRQSSIEWATKAGQLQGVIDGLTSKGDRDARALAALRLWRQRAITRMGDIHDGLLEGEAEPMGDGDGLTPERCEALRMRLGSFLDDRTEE